MKHVALVLLLLGFGRAEKQSCPPKLAEFVRYDGPACYLDTMQEVYRPVSEVSVPGEAGQQVASLQVSRYNLYGSLACRLAGSSVCRDPGGQQGLGEVFQGNIRGQASEGRRCGFQSNISEP